MPKTKAQNEQIKLERYNAILDKALYLFAIKGYNAVKIDDIAEVCHCSHGLIYHYFGNKEDLFFDLLDNVVTKKIGEIFDGINVNQNPKLVVTDYVNALLNAIGSSDDRYACSIYLALNLRFQQKDIPHPKKFLKGIDVFQAFLNVIEEGKKQGIIYDYDTREMMVTFLSLVKGLSFNRMNFGYKKFICPKSEIILNLLIKS